jgi:hypothetical protein
MANMRQSTVSAAKVFILAGVLSVFVAVPVHLLAQKQTNEPKAVSEIAGFRSWRKVNPRPLRLPAPLDALCRPATVKEKTQTSENLHRKRWFTVFVNGKAQQPMFEEGSPRFPVGAVVVKEKVKDEEGKRPEFLTIMVKRQKGFDPSAGDWEYLVADTLGRSIKQSSSDHCRSCHAQAKSTDYVFRTYRKRPDKARKEARLPELLR